MNQSQFIDQEIVRNQAEITKLSQRQTRLESAKEKLKNIKIDIIENKSNDNSPELERHRNELFEKTKNSAIKLWNKGDINWEKVVASYRFADKKEAAEWLKSKIEGLK